MTSKPQQRKKRRNAHKPPALPDPKPVEFMGVEYECMRQMERATGVSSRVISRGVNNGCLDAAVVLYLVRQYSVDVSKGELLKQAREVLDYMIDKDKAYWSSRAKKGNPA